jgi:prepilin signal peptidase PulO-like enzyme (type II secretory pathway)
MPTIISIFFFIFGTIIGSFLNVVVLRLNSGRSVSGRSFCFSCGKKLNADELIPIFSFIFQKGKCKGCKSRISFQYPIVEILTGFIFSLTFLKFQNFLLDSPIKFAIFTSISLIVFSLLIAISVYDFKHKIIPDNLAFSLILFSLFSIFINPYFGKIFLIPNFWQFLAGPFFALPFFLLWFISKGKWMGLGDAKLALGLGFFLGVYQSIEVFMLSFWIGSIIGVLLLILKGKHFTIKSEIPFAPFLIFSTMIIFLFNFDILRCLIGF